MKNKNKNLKKKKAKKIFNAKKIAKKIKK